MFTRFYTYYRDILIQIRLFESSSFAIFRFMVKLGTLSLISKYHSSFSLYHKSNIGYFHRLREKKTKISDFFSISEIFFSLYTTQEVSLRGMTNVHVGRW